MGKGLLICSMESRGKTSADHVSRAKVGHMFNTLSHSRWVQQDGRSCFDCWPLSWCFPVSSSSCIIQGQRTSQRCEGVALAWYVERSVKTAMSSPRSKSHGVAKCYTAAGPCMRRKEILQESEPQGPAQSYLAG